MSRNGTLCRPNPVVAMYVTASSARPAALTARARASPATAGKSGRVRTEARAITSRCSSSSTALVNREPRSTPATSPIRPSQGDGGHQVLRPLQGQERGAQRTHVVSLRADVEGVAELLLQRPHHAHVSAAPAGEGDLLLQ